MSFSFNPHLWSNEGFDPAQLKALRRLIFLPSVEKFMASQASLNEWRYSFLSARRRVDLSMLPIVGTILLVGGILLVYGLRPWLVSGGPFPYRALWWLTLPAAAVGFVSLYRRVFEEWVVRSVAIHPALKYRLEEKPDDLIGLHIDLTPFGRPPAVFGFTRESYRAMLAELAQIGVTHLPSL